MISDNILKKTGEIALALYSQMNGITKSSLTIEKAKDFKMSRTSLFFSSFVDDVSFIESKRFEKFVIKVTAELNDFLKENFISSVKNIKKNEEPMYNVFKNGIFFEIGLLFLKLAQKNTDICQGVSQTQLMMQVYNCNHSPLHYYMCCLMNEFINNNESLMEDFEDELQRAEEKPSFDEKVTQDGFGRIYELCSPIVQDAKKIAISMDFINKCMPTLGGICQYFEDFNEQVYEGMDVPTASELYDKCIIQTLMLHIKKKCLLDGNIIEANYSTFCKPDTDEEKFALVLEIAENFKREAENVMVNALFPIVSEKLAGFFNNDGSLNGYTKNSDIEDNKAKIDSYKAEFEKLKTEKENAESESRRLANELNRQKNDNENIRKSLKEKEKEVNGINAEYKKKYETLNETFLDLFEKHSELTEYVNMLEEESEEETEENENITIPEEILHKRFVFVNEKGKEGYVFNRRLKEIFPNSDIRYGVCDINAETTDAVILLTKYLKHGTYWSMRDKYRDKGIPVLHCNKSSISGIINTVVNETRYR